jgi:Uma2 family endonuclease
MNTIATVGVPRPESPSLGEDGERYEVVNGQRVELPPTSAFSFWITTRLGLKLGAIADAHGLGETVVETLLDLNLPDQRNRRPDVAFFTRDRWPAPFSLSREDNAWELVPDLAVEVISPTDVAESLIEKVAEYFKAGVRLVWVVYPRQALVHVYESFTSVRILTRADTLDGGAVLPGFRLPLAELLPEPATS